MDYHENNCLFSMLAQHYSGGTASNDEGSGQGEDNASEPDSTSSMGERWNTVRGDVKIYGYSVRVWGNFLGAVYQGLSRFDDTTTIDSDNITTSTPNGVKMHAFDAAFAQGYTSETELDLESALKNVKYLPGWSKERIVRDSGELVNPFDTQASGVAISEKLGYTKLTRSFWRNRMKYVGKGKYKKQKVRGMWLKPNTDTEFFSLNLKNLLPDLDNRHFYADLSVWFSFDDI